YLTEPPLPSNKTEANLRDLRFYNNDSHKSSHPSVQISKNSRRRINHSRTQFTNRLDKVEEGMRICLGVNTLSDLLGHNKDPPHVSEIPTDTETTQLDKWYTRQEQVCSIVESRLGYNANEIVQKLDNKKVLTWFEALEKEYKPSGNVIFQDLAWKYRVRTTVTRKLSSAKRSVWAQSTGDRIKAIDLR
ncbi:hypothetical protein E4U58_001409, partial [Claviceps cyperi]